MAETLSPTPRLQFLNNDGKPLVGGKIFTYSAGTSTKLATYTDSGGGTPNSNPVILDFRGEANIWIPPNVPYKYVLAPANDTDPPGSPIWTVDNIVNSQLLTLWGGVDVGSSNAYILDFVANFTSYTDGIVIYWIPSQTNTGVSTINVNGIGPVAIRQQNGDNVLPGMIQQDQIAQIIYRNGSFVLIGPMSGTFTVTLTGVSGDVFGTARWTKNGRAVTIVFPTFTGTSNATTKTYTGLPSFLVPAFDARVVTAGLNGGGANNEGLTASIAALQNVFHIARWVSDGLWTSSGVCAISAFSISYEAA